MGASDLQCFMLNHPRTSFQGMRGATYTQDVELSMDAIGIVIKNEKHPGSVGWVCAGSLHKKTELKTSCWHSLKTVVEALEKK